MYAAAVTATCNDTSGQKLGIRKPRCVPQGRRADRHRCAPQGPRAGDAARGPAAAWPRPSALLKSSRIRARVNMHQRMPGLVPAPPFLPADDVVLAHGALCFDKKSKILAPSCAWKGGAQSQAAVQSSESYQPFPHLVILISCNSLPAGP